ncbi:hypothetical protein [Mycobacterium camsae]|uniref:hypothetical protein n=1 Tax=Mycobacterium gordonae TaxID=1778 RepID=UPI0019823B32|nr:hypothetical protein [Mycobacterium gordonae]
MRRVVIATLGIVVAGGWLGAPPARADNPVCTSTWCSFLLPSRNIGCELSFQRGSGMPDETYCQSNSPPQSVRMAPAGTVKTCTGETCLGNAGEGTPVLGYGQSAGLGPFTCKSDTGGVTCTVASGRGFTLSSAGVATVG